MSRLAGVPVQLLLSVLFTLLPLPVEGQVTGGTVVL